MSRSTFVLQGTAVPGAHGLLFDGATSVMKMDAVCLFNRQEHEESSGRNMKEEVLTMNRGSVRGSVGLLVPLSRGPRTNGAAKVGAGRQAQLRVVQHLRRSSSARLAGQRRRRGRPLPGRALLRTRQRSLHARGAAAADALRDAGHERALVLALLPRQPVQQQPPDGVPLRAAPAYGGLFNGLSL